jgi:hypothetical protein
MLMRKRSDPMPLQADSTCVVVAWAVLAAALMWSAAAQAAEPSAKEAEVPLNLSLQRGSQAWTDVRTAARDEEAYRTKPGSKTGSQGGAITQPFGAGYEARMARSMAVGASGSALPSGGLRAAGSAGGGGQTPGAPGASRPSGAGGGR